MSKLREEQQKLYSEAGVNPVAGCLPLLVQLPILWALYQAIWRTNVLKTGQFLWLKLGVKDPYFVLPILAALFTFISTWLSMKSQPEKKWNDKHDDVWNAYNYFLYGFKYSISHFYLLGNY